MRSSVPVGLVLAVLASVDGFLIPLTATGSSLARSQKFSCSLQQCRSAGHAQHWQLAAAADDELSSRKAAPTAADFASMIEKSFVLACAGGDYNVSLQLLAVQLWTCEQPSLANSRQSSVVDTAMVVLVARSAATNLDIVFAIAGGLDVVHWHYHEGV
jgi:hypothetical protein